MIITKDNCPAYMLCSRGSSYKELLSQLKRLCKIVPEFTMQGLFAYEQVDDYDSKMLTFIGCYGFEMKVCASWFSIDDNKLNGDDVIGFDLESFGIKQATQNRINKIAGTACY